MKSLLFLGTLVASTIAFAETTTYDVSGMHCGGCKSMIEAKVCKMEGVQSCKVELTDKKKQTGKLTLTMADGSKADTTKVQELVSQAGEYQIVEAPAASTAAAGTKSPTPAPKKAKN